MGRKEAMSYLKRFFSILWRRRSLVRPDDRGLFDPFLPISSLKRIEMSLILTMNRRTRRMISEIQGLGQPTR